MKRALPLLGAGILVLMFAAPCAALPGLGRPALLRHQVDWFGARLDPAWPGIGDRSIGVAEVQALVGRIKAHLGELRGQPLSGSAGRWSIRNDVEFQRMLDARRRPRELAKFPGEVWRPLDLPALREAMEEALEHYQQLTGSERPLEGIDHAVLLAWIIKESGRNPYASPYASSSARSTATGLLQITRTTYDDLVRRKRFPAQALAQGLLPKRWEEPALCRPVANLLAALFVLREKARGGGGLEAALGHYYGSNDAAANARYAGGVLRGAAYVRERLGSGDIPRRLRLSASELSALLAETGRRVRQR